MSRYSVILLLLLLLLFFCKWYSIVVCGVAVALYPGSFLPGVKEPGYKANVAGSFIENNILGISRLFLPSWHFLTFDLFLEGERYTVETSYWL